MKLGATGEFPDGQWTEHDCGELQMSVGTHRGCVLFEFGDPGVRWFALPPESARRLGECLIKWAAKAQTSERPDGQELDA